MTLLGVHLARVEVTRDKPSRPEGAVVRLVQAFPFRRHVATILVDLVLAVAAYYGAYLLRFEADFETYRPLLVDTVVPIVVCQIVAMALLGAYSGLWRYASVADMVRLVRGITAGTVAGVVYLVFATSFAGLSRAVFVLDWLLLVLLVGASRVSFRLLGEVLRGPRPGSRRILIYGAGDGGDLALREVRNNPALAREAVGFIDDDRAKVGIRIHGVPVLGDLDRLEDVLAAQQIDEVVVASSKIAAARVRQLRATCATRGISVVRAGVRFE